MALNQELNKILKEMWRLDEKIVSGEELNKIETEFYKKNIYKIQEYYSKNNLYWKNKK